MEDIYFHNNMIEIGGSRTSLMADKVATLRCCKILNNFKKRLS